MKILNEKSKEKDTEKPKIKNTADFSRIVTDLSEKPDQRKFKSKPKKIKVKIINDRFEPANLKIEKGQTVEWSLKFALEENHSSLYHLKNRTHVVSFENINEESGLMRTVTDSFRVKFSDTGVFKYKCSIYTRMVGSIEVVEPAQDIKVQTVKDIQNIIITPNPRVVYNIESENQADLNKRLIKVLGEEEDLRDTS